jgi:phosphomannomutase
MQVSTAAFKAYDIRGIVPAALNEPMAEALGKAFGTCALREGQKAVAVGRDGRLSGPALVAALTRGLVGAGVDVIDVGMVTTPMLYFAANTLCESGIQVTGSHNPKDYNGFKMVMGGRAIYGDEIQSLRQMIEDEAWQLQSGGRVRNINIEAPYRDRIVSDGTFPNHHPDPSKIENLRDVVHALKTTDAEIGFAFDGDGDRLGVVTKDGNVIYPDRQIMLFAQDVLSRVPGGTILFDVKCTQRLAPFIEAAGGKAMMYKTGHSLIKAKMKEVNSPFSGEMSGHLFFKERWFGFDDGTYAGARLLEILSASSDASAVLNALPTSFSTPELNVPCAEGEPHRVVEQLLKVAKFDAPAKVSSIDGLRVDWPDGFGLIRGSNTTPVLVLRFEGHNDAALHRIEATMMALLKTVKPDARVEAPAH